MSLEPFVRYNVDTFLDLFQRVARFSGKRTLKFRTWVDGETGQLCFFEEGRAPLALQSRKWEKLDFTCFYDVRAAQIHLEEKDSCPTSLKPVPLHIVQKSLDALKHLEGSTLCTDQITDQQFISKIWYPVDRKEAEQLLFQMPIGTYLFRQDLYSVLLEEKLCAEACKKISLWTLTALVSRHKCCDYTLVHTEEGWQIYNDDLSLHQETFPGLLQLIRSLRGVCRYPLYRDNLKN